LPTRLPDKVKKPKWAKPRKPHGKASARSFTGAEAAEIAANKAEQSSKVSISSPGARTLLRVAVLTKLSFLGLPSAPASPREVPL
jgi:hypothetical protein